MVSDINENKHLAKIWRWQMRCGTNDDVIISFKAKDNIKLSISWYREDGITTTFDNTSLRFYGSDTNDVPVFIDSRPIVIGATGSNNEYDISLSLKTGQSLYICYTSNNDSYGVIQYAPLIQASMNLYDENETINYQAMNDLASYKTSKKSSAAWYVNGSQCVSSDYLIYHYTYIQDIYVATIRSIDNATSIVQVDSIYNEYKTRIMGVKDAARFVKSYLHIQDYDIDLNDTEGDDSCILYYPEARTAYNSLSETARNTIMNDNRFLQSKNRLQSWASAYNDYFDSNNAIVSLTDNLIVDNDLVSIISMAVVLSICSFIFVATLKNHKRNKHE